MADPGFKPSESVQIYHKGEKKMMSQKEAVLATKKSIDEEVEAVALHHKAIKMVQADCERKVAECEKQT